jgi:class 3 adenylate cyclase
MEIDPDQSSLKGQGHRTLAAIVFSDVVNYSGRMSRDEEYTLKLVRRDLNQMTRFCEKFEGKVLKFTGDGLLMYFNSAVQAVTCALEIQKAFAQRATELSAEEVLQHRIGIHLGDVFVSPTDVVGDGVNIAARLQSEAEPGGICLSQIVYDVVKKRLELQATYLGPRELKHIQEAIPIYQIVLAAQSKSATPLAQSAKLAANLEHDRSLKTVRSLKSGILNEAAQKSLERLLAEYIGPIAPVLVQQTLQQVATPQEGITRLSLRLPQSDQEAFRERAERILNQAKEEAVFSQSGNSLPQSLSPVEGNAEEKIAPDVMQRCEYELMRAIGPIAPMIVQRTLSQDPDISLSQLIEALAKHLPTADRAEAFRQNLQDLL